MASGDKAKQPRQGLTCNKFSLHSETMQKLYKYLLWPLEKTLSEELHS